MSTHLRHASERLETTALEAIHAGASDEIRDRLGLHLDTIDGTTVSIVANDPSPLFNRAVGLGLSRPVTADSIERICRAYREHDVERFYLGVHPAARPEGIEQLLETAGLKPDRGWMKFERNSDPPPAAESQLDVREIGEEHVGDFARIATNAYGLTPDAALMVRGLVDRPEFHLYMTFDGDTPAGTGAMIVDGECAWFEMAATDPAFRQRGSQRALLAQRIEDAVDAGCTRLLTCTGVAVPGDPQHSYHNIEWAGFEPQYVRNNWVPK